MVFFKGGDGEGGGGILKEIVYKWLYVLEFFLFCGSESWFFIFF